MKGRLALQLTLMSCTALYGASGHCPAKSLPLDPSILMRSAVVQPSQLAQTGQKRSDRVVGYWMSSTGVAVTLAYTGNADSLWVQVFPKPGRSNPRVDYTARWTSENQFVYMESSGSRISGKVEPSGQTILLTGTNGWSATWTRTR